MSEEPHVSDALLFGSTARWTSHPFNAVHVAIGTSDRTPIPTFMLGQLTSRLEDASGRAVHLVVLDEAPSARDNRTSLPTLALFQRAENCVT